MQESEKEIQWLLYSNQETFLKSVIWGNFFGFMTGTVFFLISILYIHKKKKCVKFMQAFQMLYLFYLLAGVLLLTILGMFSYAFIAIATNLCSKGSQLLSYKNSTINIFPEVIHPLARECFYSTSSGEISNLLNETDRVRLRHILNIFDGQSVDNSSLNFTDSDPDPPVVDDKSRVPFLSSRILHHRLIQNVAEDPINLFWSNPSRIAHSPRTQISQINEALECLNPKQVFAVRSNFCPVGYGVSSSADAFNDHLDKNFCVVP